MVFAAVSDTLSMTIANRVPLLLLAVFARGRAADRHGLGRLWLAFRRRRRGAGVTFGMFAVGGMGGGDAKLLAATAVWMGFNVHLIEYLVASAFLGGVLTVAILAYRGSALAVYTGQNMFLSNFADPKGGVPYGIALGIGGLVTYPGSPLMVWALERLGSRT